MDFDLTEEQAATVEAASGLLADKSTPELLRALELADDTRFDRSLWSAMADAGLLSLVIAEADGGAGLGIVEGCLVLQEVGRRTAAVPALSTMVCSLALSTFGTDEQRALLPAVTSGDTVIGLAITEALRDPADPGVTATGAGGEIRLRGTKTNVIGGVAADLLVVTAANESGVGVYLVEADADGATRERQDTTSGVPEARFEFDGVSATRLGGDAAVAWLIEHATVALCAVMAGVCEEAIRITGVYTVERHQFDRPLATFQAVGQRAADAYVDTQAVLLTMLQAAWRLGNGHAASKEVAVAKYWASTSGHRALHACMHLHGGVGVDRDYPLHRYFLLAKQLELSLGGSSRQLLSLGRMLAAES